MYTASGENRLDRYAEQIRRAEQQPEYWAAVLTNDFAAQLQQRMKQLGVSPAELSQRMGCSLAYVSQILRGDANLSPLTMAKAGIALGGVPVLVSLSPGR